MTDDRAVRARIIAETAERLAGVIHPLLYIKPWSEKLILMRGAEKRGAHFRRVYQECFRLPRSLLLFRMRQWLSLRWKIGRNGYGLFFSQKPTLAARIDPGL